MIKLGYGEDWLNPPQARRLLNQLEHILHSAANDPQQAHTSVSVLSDQERQTLLHTWNQTDAPYPRDKTLHQLFEEQAEKTPDHIALVFEGEALTYRELNERANQLASVIRQNNERNSDQPLQPDTLIALYFDRSIEMVISILAVLKAGGAYVPISPEYPAERTGFILEDTQATLLLTQQRHLDVLSTVTTGLVQKPTLIAADNTQVTAGMPTGNLPAMSGSTDLAYVIYTSGTTGKPKGVLTEQRGVISLIQSNAYVMLSDQDVFLHLSDPCFDAATFELWGALTYGAKLVIPSPKEHLSVDMIAKLLTTHNVSVLWLTRALFDSLYVQDSGLFSSLNYLLVGGEALTADIIRTLVQQENRPNHILNGYGPTESTTFTTTYDCSKGFLNSVPLGKPINTRKVYILDEYQQLMPIGASGELYIGGAGLARGYLNRPELTTERFIDNPFATEADKAKGYTRLYKTGDLVRWLPDGNLEYLGRNDFQVKIRGFRIELGEIESALNALPQVKQAVVIERERESHQYLAAYVVPVDGNQVNADQLIERLSARLPEYMVPSTFTQIESMPLTINGKLDRRALPEPEWTGSDNYVAPRNALEKQLCVIWQEVLGLKRVGIHDNFFRIGGDSISAIKLTAAMRRECQIDVPLSLLFAHKTIAGLAVQLGQLTCVVIPHQDLESYPLSFAQERMLFIERFEQGSSVYHIPQLVQLSDDVALPVLMAAINTVVNRHPVMKSVYQTDTEGNSYQRALETDISLQTIDLADENALLSAVKAEIATPFDLTAEPSLRLCHYQIANQAYLLLMWHHIAMDGWSVDVFIQELSSVYQSLGESREVSLPELDITYGDYARWQRDYLQSEVGEQQRRYWQDTLSGYELLLLPTDKPRPNHVDYTGNNYNFALDETLSAQLRVLAQKQETTLYTVLLAAFYATLSKLSGQTDIVLGTPTDNRHHAQTQSLLGMFVNSLALRAQVTPDLSVEGLIAHTHDVVTQAKSRQDMPFEQLVDLLDVERDMSRHPIFQVMFSVQSFGNHAETAGSLPWTPVPFGDDLYTPAKYDLSLFLSDDQAYITGTFNFAVSLFDEASVERMAERYQRVLTAWVNDTHQHLTELDVLSAQERHTLLHTWNQTDAPYPQDQTLHQLFEAQVEKTPDHIALVFENEALTYRELNERANQLASAIGQDYKQRQGQPLQPDTLIALYLDRSVEMIISILAVLKAGGAYVPISPEYPQERIRFILEDTQAALLLTQQRHVEALSTVTTELAQKPMLITVDDIQATKGIPTDNLPSISGSTDLAYVIYTSGTTGKPKGVLIEHMSVVNTVIAMIQAYDLQTGCNRVSCFSNYTFDVFVSEIFNTLLFGGELHLLNEHSRKDTVQLSHYIDEHEINFMFIPPVVLAALPKRKHNSLKAIVFAGEKCEQSSCLYWNQNYQLYNYYGPTEATIYAAGRLTSERNLNEIGCAIKNCKLYVLTDHLQLAPMGVSGELYIGGAGLARGYLNRPDLTAERFIDNPFATEADKAKGYTRLYKTGDLVRWLSDGNLEYLGRNDFQVKIRGFRIELGEIENALSELPQVKQAIVIAREHQSHQYLAAYVVPAEGNRVDLDQLIEQLSARLPDYMMPSTFTQIESVPLTTNGKLDRRALPEPEWTDSDNYVAPRNELEKQLCLIWQDVLGLECVGIADDFFQIGGNSIFALQLVNRMNLLSDVSISLSNLFISRTIEQISKLIDNQVKYEYQDFIRFLTPSSEIKRNLFLIHPANAGCEVYNELVIRLDGAFNCIGIDNFNLINDTKIGSLSSLASLYLDAMVANNLISQPVNLLGWSMGGYIALEIAYLLEARGINDINVYLLDTYDNSLDNKTYRLDDATICTNLKEMGFDNCYIDNVIKALPFEDSINNSPLSGCLNKSNVILFKASDKSQYFPENEDSGIITLFNMSDNNISRNIKSDLRTITVKGKNHHNIIEAIDLIGDTLLDI
ncbi:non-ribosomal peptide synthetase [Xenorhabdus vietnamensis]|uniref:non-ribosomal peptide synthetase n=1 Tax=Xenorhabdus vietnamensis TaxID=351656 RepID=UPI001ABF4C1E|nr:non-ribosomal peptide synthetase [Xenorhabdus vietnamensis]